MTNQELLHNFQQHLKARNLSKNYYNTISLWFKYLEEKGIEYNQFTAETITQFFIDHAYYKNGSKSQYIKAGRYFYGQFLQIPKEQNEWYKSIKLLKVERKIPDYFTEEDLKDMVRYLITYHSRRTPAKKIRALLYFMYFTGVRKHEILLLKRADFDLTQCKAKVYGKGSKERYVYYTNKVKEYLEEYFKSDEEKINAFNITLGQLNYLPQMIKKHFPNRRIYLHLFRHSFGREFMRNGGELLKLSKILGHTDTKTTEIYANPFEQEIDAFYKKIMNKGAKQIESCQCSVPNYHKFEDGRKYCLNCNKEIR